MYTTLNQIRASRPCATGWNTLLVALCKIEADDEPLALLRILETNGLDDAIWALRACPSALPRVGEFAQRAADRAKGYADAAAAARYAAAAAAELEKQKADFLELFRA